MNAVIEDIAKHDYHVADIGQAEFGRREIAIAKAWAGEAYERVVTQSHQIHGAIGCTIDHDLQFYTKRGKAAQLSFGDGDYHRETVAQQMGL